jgi:hypothetical protein
LCSHEALIHGDNPISSKEQAVVRISEAWTPRRAMVETIAKQLTRGRMLHIRGSQCSGLTVLMALLADYLKAKYPDYKIRSIFSWRKNMDHVESQHYLEGFLTGGKLRHV